MKKVTKLLAVVAMAASPAAADPRTTKVDPWDAPARATDPWDAPARDLDPATPRRSLTDVIALVTARPRQMPSGAPACGNVASRAPRPADCGAATPTSNAPTAARPTTTPTRGGGR